MDEIIVIIMGVFIANYKAEEHPYITNCIKALLISILGIVWLIGKDLVSGQFTWERASFGLLLSIGLWIFLTLGYIFFEFIFKNRK